MIAVVGWRCGPMLASACVFLTLAGPAFAQQQPLPLPNPPTTPQFLSRYDFHMNAAFLGSDDHARFMWDTRWGGDFDLVDYVAGRLSVIADYQAVLGNEYGPFDPNQGNYTLELSGSKRFGQTELAGVLHHVSRHLSDRPKRMYVAMNVAEARVLRRFNWRGTAVDVTAEGGHLLNHSYVDYAWTGKVDMTARRRVNDVVSGYGRVFGEFRTIDGETSERDTQRGGRLEGGVRLQGAHAAMELFAGWEQVIDADALDRQTRSWPFAGFRLVN